MHPKPPSQTELEEIQTAAENTFKHDKSVLIHLYEHDFNGIQKKALQLGIPYQTLIAGVIHQYVEGDFVVKANE
jgi:predicted DNA binding CopG/RHH family protein